MSFTASLKHGLSCHCPKCGKGALFEDGRFNFELRKQCPSCGLDYTKNDAADGPAFILSFVLGILIVPLALLVDALFDIPLLLHLVIWSIVCIGAILLSLKPLKSYIMYVQFKHRPGDWES